MNEPVTVDPIGYTFDEDTGLIYQVFKKTNHVCDLCGYIDRTKMKSAVRKFDDGVYRCKVCAKKLGIKYE